MARTAAETSSGRSNKGGGDRAGRPIGPAQETNCKWRGWAGLRWAGLGWAGLSWAVFRPQTGRRNGFRKRTIRLKVTLKA